MKVFWRVNKSFASFSFGFYWCFLIFSFSPVKANNMSIEKYLISFKSNRSTCILRVNGMPAIENSIIPSRTMSAGINTTAFLGNGENDVELLIGPANYKDKDSLVPDASCQIVISKDTKDNSTVVASFKLSVDSNGGFTASESPNYHAGEFNTEVLEGYTKNKKDFGLYKLRSKVIIKGLPKWSWADATPVTEKDIPKIRKAYSDIWNMMKVRDLDELKKIATVSSEEMAFAEGSTTRMMFASTGFPERVIDKKLTPIPIVWDEYDFLIYANGRLFRLAAGYFQNSPLQFQDENRETVFVYNPYFSIVNGKVVLVR